MQDGHLDLAVRHPPRDCWVKLPILGRNDRVARLIAPGGDSQLGVEGSAEIGIVSAP